MSATSASTSVTTPSASVSHEVDQLLQRLGVPRAAYMGGTLAARSPITGEVLAQVPQHNAADATAAIGRAHAAFNTWRNVPAPRRGELVRLLGEELRAAKADLGLLVTIEAGKIPSEGLGEVQEMIDICDFAVGLSRQLYGLTIATERPGHRMMETWHPLGVCGVISAFNFPVAVWSWNAALAVVCGDPVVWKPSEKTPLTALATHAIAQRALAHFGSDAPAGLLELIIGQRDIGEVLVQDARVPVLSATGSTAMGRSVGPRLAARFARAILELGGNNAAIVAPSADLDLALRGIVFAAAGTAGQRCTSMRRVIAHESVAAELTQRIAAAYDGLPVGDPLQDGTLVGPLINDRAYERMQDSIQRAVAAGGTLVTGGERVDVNGADSYYVRPALITMPEQSEVVCEETFAPLLYVMTYTDFDDAIALHNAVPQGLSSSVFTLNQREAELFMSAAGSDCGIVNVNIGTSGAEIGGAFGGEKTTGGGRESGSDAWRGYMRRATNTINYSTELPLAQGVNFG